MVQLKPSLWFTRLLKLSVPGCRGLCSNKREVLKVQRNIWYIFHMSRNVKTKNNKLSTYYTQTKLSIVSQLDTMQVHEDRPTRYLHQDIVVTQVGYNYLLCYTHSTKFKEWYSKQSVRIQTLAVPQCKSSLLLRKLENELDARCSGY